MAAKRLHAVFQGRVQGVGFRYTTVHVASGFNVAGFVRNLPDGDVELVAEGEASDIMAFLDGLRRSHIFRYVLNERLNWSEATGRYAGFTVEH